jgi:hypothetical protein
MSRVVDIAQAVVDLLNAASLGVIAVRSYKPQYELAEMDEPHITVVPKSIASERLDRSSFAHSVAVDIAIQQRAMTDDEIDALMDFPESLADLLWANAIDGAILLGVQNEVPVSPEELAERHLFVSLLTATYQVIS